MIGTCRACGAESIINRATDLKGTYPSAEVSFHCPSCGRLLRPSGDIANHPVDQFVYDAWAPMRRRQYMQVILLTAQSLELTLTMCLAEFVVGKLRRPKKLRESSPFAKVAREVEGALDTLTLGALRIVVANLALQTRPTSAAQSLVTVATIKKLRGRSPVDTDVAAIPDSTLREAIQRLLAVPNFVKLRNMVVHEAHRPTQEQAEWCMKEIPLLTRALLRGFGIAQGQLVMPPTAA